MLEVFAGRDPAESWVSDTAEFWLPAGSIRIERRVLATKRCTRRKTVLCPSAWTGVDRSTLGGTGVPSEAPTIAGSPVRERTRAALVASWLSRISGRNCRADPLPSASLDRVSSNDAGLPNLPWFWPWSDVSKPGASGTPCFSIRSRRGNGSYRLAMPGSVCSKPILFLRRPG